MITESNIVTKEGSAYIRKLCRHFSVKVPASYTEYEGLVDFVFGKCTMSADSDLFTIRVEVADDESAQKAEQVIVSHLLKFSWREELNIHWNRKSLS